MLRIVFPLIATFVLAISQVSWGDTSDDSLKAAQAALTERVDGMAETAAIMTSDISLLKRLKVSGYVQGRYETNDSSRSGVGGGYDVTKNLNANNFYIRRGRIKFTFEANASSKFVIYLDGSKNSISMKEAYLELNKLHREHSFKLTAGQFNYPFGYEIEYSSSKRDFPERSLAENRLFRGERDRGVNLTWTAPRLLQANLGFVQGYGIENSTFTWFDPTKQKDIIGRVKATLGMVDVGFSTYWGETYTPGSAPVAAAPASTKWVDANLNEEIDEGEVTNTPAVAAKPAGMAVNTDKIRYGLDAQAYFDVLPIGGTALRWEFYYGEDYQKASTDLVGISKGWYLWLSQSLGTKFGAAIRYDFFDPNIHSDYAEADPSKLAVLSNDAVGTTSIAVHYFWDANVRITAAYDIFKTLEDGSMFSKYDGDVDDNRFTLQFQFAID
ncbi:MAG: porin [Candidatus Zixiibacteriota bacterium]